MGEYLKIVFPNHEFIHNKKVPNSGINRRPDYRNDELKLIVEFDGYRHYISSSKVLSEDLKTKTYTKMGYKVVRIPYFVQMSNQVIKTLFDVDVDIPQVYPHGFIDSQALLPADYCYLGIMKFIQDLDNFDFIKEEIVASLKNKVKDLQNKFLVLPSPLHHLI